MHIKLVSLPIMCALPPFKFTRSLPYGLGILTAFLKEKGYDVILEDLHVTIEENRKKFWFPSTQRIDMDILLKEEQLLGYISGRSKTRRVSQFAEQTVRLVSCQGYDVVGISIGNYLQFIFALILTKKLKSESSLRVVLGGPFITIYGKALFNEFPSIRSVGIDYLIVGDGQVPLLKLVEYLEGKVRIDEVPSVIYRQNGEVKVNPREFFPIEDLSVPDFSDLPLDFYRSNVNGNGELKLPYQVTRGCTHSCSFCGGRTILSHAFETKSYEKVVRELKYMRESYKSNFFVLSDDTINCSYEYLDALCDIFIRENLEISWAVNARPDNLDRPMLHKMKQAGCYSISYGIESGSNRILRMMGKGFTAEQASNTLRDAHAEGIENRVCIIVGYP